MRRLLGCGCLTLVVLIIVCIGGGYFVALPHAQNKISDQFAHAISTGVAGQVRVAPGIYTITEQQMTTAINDELTGFSGASINSTSVNITPERIQFVLKSDSQDFTYDVQVAAKSGRLVVTSLTPSDGNIKYVIPNDKVKSAIEKGVNDVLIAHGVVLKSIVLNQGSMTLTTEAI
jgi:hypothetical protein